MADSEISVKVTADVASAKQGLKEVATTTEDIGKKTTTAANASTGAVLQLGGSVLSLKNGLSSLARGQGGVGALLQVAGAGRAAGGALAGLGGAGAGAGAAVAGGFALAAAAVVGVGLEVAQASIGTDAWAKTSNDAIGTVTGWWGKAKGAVSDYWKETAVGSMLEEGKARKKQEEVASAMALVLETERMNNLKGESLRDELRIAEAAGDAVKAGQLYARVRKEMAEAAKKEKEETLETANILAKNSPEQAAATKEGERMSREGAAMDKAVAIGKQQKVEPVQAQRLDQLEKLVKDSVGNKIANALANQNTTGQLTQLGDPAAKRQIENNIVNLAKTGVAMETIVASLDDAGLGSEEIVSTLEDLQKRLPQGFTDALLKHMKPGIIAWK